MQVFWQIYLTLYNIKFIGIYYSLKDIFVSFYQKFYQHQYSFPDYVNQFPSTFTFYPAPLPEILSNL